MNYKGPWESLVLDPTHHTLFELGRSVCAAEVSRRTLRLVAASSSSFHTAEASNGSLRLVAASSSSLHTNIELRRGLMESEGTRLASLCSL